jgi:hypothetical protein
MNAAPTRIVVFMPALALALLGVPGARADEDTHASGDHPALVVQRLHRTAGYDYASKFYPHPAWLRLYLSPPPDMTAPAPDGDLAASVSPARRQGSTAAPASAQLVNSVTER